MTMMDVFPTDIYHFTFTIIFVITTSMLFFMIYLIIKHSARLDEYKFYLLNNIIWSYVLHILLSVARPRFLFPKLLVYFDGPVKNCGQAVVYCIMGAIMVSTVFMICGILMTLGFRYGQLLPFSVTSFFKKQKIFWLCITVEHGIGLSAIILPLMTINFDKNHINTLVQTNDNISSPFTSYTPYLTIPSLFALNTTYFKPTLYLIYGFAGAYIIVMGLAYLHMKFIVYSSTNRVFYFTYQLQNMLVNAYAAETLATLFLIILPLLCGLYVTEQQFYYSSFICECFIILASFYPMVLFLTIIVFIKPYRVCIKNAFKAVIAKLPKSVQQMFSGCTVDTTSPINIEQQCYQKHFSRICFVSNDLVPQDDGYI